MEIKICHMYPDVLNLYGDRGNVICMKYRLQRRGIQVKIIELPIGEKIDFSDCDIIFVGGGQDFEQRLIMDDFDGAKTSSLKSAIEDGVTMLAICGGYQMLGHYYETSTGEKLKFTGLLDLYTVSGARRMVGNFRFHCTAAEISQHVIGFENHSGKTFLASELTPLGRVTAGYGNNGEDRTEGIRYKNVFGSYCHGPMLPKNPEFCDYILKCALNRKYGTTALDKLDDSIENLAYKQTLRRI